ncbi:MAG TPA: glycogen/starch synthase [Candidatus Omnitrophota bacterium]|nr:glycogen/starch synthase [Candidatus Omnitrophota bacterium]
MAQRFRVAILSAECVPFAKVGGLGDVTGALSRAVADLGCSVAVVLPRYGDLTLPEGATLELVGQVEVPVAGNDETALLYRLHQAGLPGHLHHFFLANETWFGRDGIYADPKTGTPFADNAERWVFFARAALEALRAAAYAPEVIHANDHQTALAPAYLKTLLADDPFFQMTATILAIHNLGYQGVYPPETMRAAGFPEDLFHPLSPFEFWGKMNFLKAGIHFADVLVTVSERYAEEIQSGEEFGFGLQGVLNARRTDLVGILNGIDVKTWNPRTDRHLAARYDAESLDAKERCTEALLEEMGLSLAPRRPVFGMISRLVEQKGLDLIRAAADRLFALPARWVFLGNGEREYEEFLQAAARRHPDRVAFRRGFDDPLAHRIEAGADFFLMPSRYEPCGLNQMMSMRYGTVPVVRATGGLADTVDPVARRGEEGTGIRFEPYTAEALVGAAEEAVALFAEPASLALVRRQGMARDFSWESSARKYIHLYRQANAARRMGSGFNRWLEAMEGEGRRAGGPPSPPPLTRGKGGV